MKLPTNHSHCSRRKVLTLGAGYLLAGSAGWQAHAKPSSLKRSRRQSHALGSQVTLTALHEDRETAASALDAAFRELEGIEEILSIYRPQSQVSQLNRCGVLEKPHRHLVNVLTYAQSISKVSKGAFDVTVQPLWEVFQEAQKRHTLPDEANILVARNKVDWQRVKLSPERIALEGNGTAITLNGIAQGYAADCVKQVLAGAGIEHALVDCGEFTTMGTSAKAAPWKVGIQHPREEEAFVSVARMSGRCLATSGDYATRFSEDYRWNHLFDPRTGRSPEEFSSVSVAAPTAMAADALSTAISVAGVDHGMGLMETFPDTDAFLVLKNGRTLTTKGFPC
jgi:thiamine biosynthesis lipoprotein